MSAEPPDPQQTFYQRVGGHDTFDRLTRGFYDRVAEDATFRAMYPEQDLEPARVRLMMFLEQYWGGPTTYSEQRGHPRLRMRHFPFQISSVERDTWLRHMRGALDDVGLSAEDDAILWDYLTRAADSLRNTPDAP
ncbi:globin [Naumannella sp. ID2617S]|uniref:Globin n=1 Tax=Enemella dayhoffiae TaxID=2016507 RepID=A0A255H2P8_9ACTN|nr:globin [Enemella dayhoffiae]NNG20339.1 globin [Naumannella sp. ID2617S]OYO20934.1 globin [Enemella dayhoffiae]